MEELSSISRPAAGIAMYAELLPNIGQVSVAAALPSPSDASTSAEVVDGGRRLRIWHRDRAETLDLPAAVAVPAALAVPQMPCSFLAWRLPAPAADARASFSSPESQPIPWSSVDLKTGPAVGCRACGNDVVRLGRIGVWKDLPSENWAEMMEFWHCHKPRDDGKRDDEALADRGYGANNAIAARPGVGFVDTTSLMFSESDCHNLLFSSSPSGTTFGSIVQAMDQEPPRRKHGYVFCGSCSTQIGLYAPAALSVTLFKWQVSCETLSPGRAPSVAECLAAALLAAISRSACAKSVVAPYASDGHQASTTEALHLWVLNSSVVYTSSARQGKRPAMKMLYRVIGLDEGHGLVDSMTSDVQEINLPTGAVETVRRALEASTALMPERERSFKGWSAGLLERRAPET